MINGLPNYYSQLPPIRGDDDPSDVMYLGSHGVAMIVTALDETRAAERLHLLGVADNARVARILDIAQVAVLFA